LDALIKQHHETGEYGFCHLAMPQTQWGAFRARDLPRPEPRPAWAPDLGQIMGLPIVLDNDVPHNEWQLRTNESREVVKSGVTRKPEEGSPNVHR
jgi:hypothetical protein